MGIEAASKQTQLIIDFLIIGAGVSGLSCAIALRRVGHRVVVVEREKEIGQSDVGRGVRLPPNLSKILYRWNLKSEVSAFAAKSKQIQISRLDTGDRLGDHYWDDEVLRETQGEFLFGHLADLRKMMYDVAVGQGATVRLGTTAVSVDPKRREITLDSGETLTADVVIGADGAFGLVRPLLLNEQGIQEATKPTMCMYSATVPKALVEKDPQSKHFYEPKVISMFSFFGNNQSVISHPTGGLPCFTFTLFRRPHDEYESSHSEGMRAALESVVPRLRNLGPMISQPRRFPIFEHPPLEDWLADSGRVVVVGGAAHPIPTGSTQQYAMGLEDAAVLAKLFSHLATDSQITDFLYAFQELRQPRAQAVLTSETGVIHYMGMPNCPDQEARDQAMQEKHKAGGDLFSGDDESAEWAEIKTVFGYDAEDEADNWWVTWGLLKARSSFNDGAQHVFATSPS
ncbi:6-hydroxynicotinate 3-monooxygenase [Favolaschia claudopus]|uniref:6-hydroxynicotinate 3-monooxygenase n=1 Tax=Favolaschia claudopus TaxID=2862362 RepID=A0AAW0B5F1_9AGAR